MNLPSFKSYGNYKSSNYGAHCLAFTTGKGTVFFSYSTPVAFETNKTGLVVRVNDWSNTTGKHLNAIDGGDKKKRISGEHFETLLAKNF